MKVLERARVAALAALMAWSSGAAAQEPTEEDFVTWQAPTPVAPSPGSRRHDGAYLRLGVGPGLLAVTREGHVPFEGGDDGGFSGRSTLEDTVPFVELSVGGTVGHLAVHATALVATVSDPILATDRGRLDLEGEAGFFFLGPGLDWFPSLTGGFHLGAAAGIAVLRTGGPVAGPFEETGGFGSGASVLAAYEFWALEQVSVGGGLRLTGAWVDGETTVNILGTPGDPAVTGEEDDSVVLAALCVSVLIH